MKPTRIGVLGCGKVSHMYLPVLTRLTNVDLQAVADVDSEVANTVAKQYEVARAVSPDELLADPDIEIILNLTPISAHVAVTRAALEAGKHVYSEKPLTTEVADASGLLDEADRRGLVLACAPDTLLGTGFQVARAALAAGAIGKPLTATALMLRGELTKRSFYSEGPTAFFDMAPYYISALVSMFGPATSVSATTSMWPETGEPPQTAAGASIAVTGVIDFANGATSSATLAWGTTVRGEVPVLTVYGSEGVLAFPNPNNFGDPAYVRAHGETEWTELDGSRQPESWPRNLRGLGVGEMAQAIQSGQEPRTSGHVARHVVDVIAGMVRSADTASRVDLTTTCKSPEPMPADARTELLG